MTNLQRRLHKLEARTITDSSGFLPHSPEWIEYWMREIPRLWAEDHSEARRRIPLEAVRCYLQNGPDCP